MTSSDNKPRSFVAYRKGITNVLATKVRIGEAFNPQPSIPPPLLIEYTAIWDTGATHTVITQKVVDECELKPIGMAKVHTANGERNCHVYLVSIHLPNDVGITSLRVTEGVLSGDAEVLVGMDIINLGDFAITNKDGKTTFSFRIPSMTVIDFVKLSAPTTSLKVNETPKGNRAERRRAKKRH